MCIRDSIVAIANGTNLIMYVNGNLSTDVYAYDGTIMSSEIDPFSQPIYIGSRNTPSGFFSWNGTIDDVMFFNRSLSEAEVLGIYANQSTRTVTRNFSGLDEREYSYTAYAQDTTGRISEETRTVTISTDSCSCPGSGNWHIINGDECELTTTCDLTTNKFRVLDGKMRILSGGYIRAGGGCYVNDSQSLYVDDSGGLFCG